MPALLVPAILRLGRESQATIAIVDEGKRGLLYLEGRFTRELASGTYAFWNAAGAPRVDVLDLRLQTLEVPGQEILTRDKVTVRVNVSAVYQIVDAVVARSRVKRRVRASIPHATDRCPADARTAVSRGVTGG